MSIYFSVDLFICESVDGNLFVRLLMIFFPTVDGDFFVFASVDCDFYSFFVRLYMARCVCFLFMRTFVDSSLCVSVC